ncbi:MAG: tetratricopeptide repeat protein [Chloroflexota bacterium]
MCAEESKRVIRQLGQQAIDLALQGNWTEAVDVNGKILESLPKDVEANNRLGRALIELARFAAAREAYNRALQADPHNSIARKNLARLATLSRSDGEASVPPSSNHIAPELFVTEMGKSAFVSLELPAPKEALARLSVGDPVSLVVRGGNVIAENAQQRYLGEVEPRYGLRLARLIEGGNRYTAVIARLDGSKVKLVIREMYQHPSQRGRPSFPVKIPTWGQQHAYIKDTLVRRDYDAEAAFGGEEEEETIPEGFSIIEEALPDGEDFTPLEDE